MVNHPDDPAALLRTWQSQRGYGSVSMALAASGWACTAGGVLLGNNPIFPILLGPCGASRPRYASEVI